jgi:TolB-like protein/tetratricopeptide (TPR) repeat protein
MSGDLPAGDATQSSGSHASDRPPLSKDVFVSYASPDAAVANSVVEALEGQGIRCWIAPRDVTPGEFYAGVIVHAIDEAKATVLILSRQSAASPHVVREVERAASKRHPVISLRIDLAPLPADLEYFLNTSQWLDASEGEPSRVFPRLVEAVRKVLSGGSASGSAQFTPAVPIGGPLRGPQRRSLSRPAAVVLGVVVVAIAGFAIDRWWVTKHSAEEKSVAAAAPAVPLSVSATPVIPEKSVAVLPFVDMSEKKDQEYFSDGLSEELIDMLTKVPNLRVPARTSSFFFKGKQTTVADIAKALSVSHVLEGSVRKSGNTLRITAQLIRVDNGYHVWSETYDRKLDDIFKVQDEIAGAVVKALQVSLMGGLTRPESIGTRNIEAYNLFLQANSMWRHANEREDFERTAGYLRRVVDADPQFADAWALLSRALLAEATSSGVPDQQLIGEARRAANQALKLNSALSAPHVAYAALLWNIDFDVRGVEAQIQRALELDPNSAEALRWGDTLPMFRGQLDKALGFVQKSIAIDPVNPDGYADLNVIYYFAGKYPEALAANQKMFDLDPGEHVLYHRWAAFVLLAKGEPAAALSEIESDKQVRENCSCLVLAYDALGRKAEADAALGNLEKHHALDGAYDIALVYARRGELDQAFEWLDRAYQQREPSLYYLKLSQMTKNLRSDPRFNIMLRKLGLLD